MVHRTEPYLSVREVAQRWGVHRNTIYNLIRRGEIRVVRVSPKAFRIAREEVERFERERLS